MDKYNSYTIVPESCKKKKTKRNLHNKFREAHIKMRNKLTSYRQYDLFCHPKQSHSTQSDLICYEKLLKAPNFRKIIIIRYFVENSCCFQ